MKIYEIGMKLYGNYLKIYETIWKNNENCMKMIFN